MPARRAIRPPAPALLFPAMARELDPSRRTVVDARPGHYLCHPDLIRTSSGRLLAAYREADRHVRARRKKLLLRVSDDNGASWSAPRTLLADGGHCARLAELSDGWIVGVTDGPNTMFWSGDNGETWAAHPATGLEWGIPDRPLELDCETLLTATQFPRGACARPSLGQAPIEQMVFRSDTRGARWTAWSVLSPPGPLALCEASMARLPDGRLLALLRENSGAHEPAYYCLSHDDGQTWSDPRASAIIAHRPTLGVARDGMLVVTYRDVSPRGGVAAWRGTVDDLLAGFTVHGHVSPAGAARVEPGGMVIDPHAGAALFCLRPLTEPRHARAVLEAEVETRPDSPGAELGGIRLGTWFRLRADHLAPEIDGASPLPLEAGRPNRLRLEWNRGTLSVAINDTTREKYVLEGDTVERRAIMCGAMPGAETPSHAAGGNLGSCVWRSLRLDIEEPRLSRTHAWSWTPDKGLPHAASERSSIILDSRRNVWPGDYGYTGWVETAPGEFFCVYHAAPAPGRAYEQGRESHIAAARFHVHDFE